MAKQDTDVYGFVAVTSEIQTEYENISFKFNIWFF